MATVGLQWLQRECHGWHGHADLREFACHTAVILAQPRVSRLRVAVKNAFHRDHREPAAVFAGRFACGWHKSGVAACNSHADSWPRCRHSRTDWPFGKFRVGMAQIWSRGVQQYRRFVASMSPRSHRLAVLKIPRGDGANLEFPRATVTQIRRLDVATLAPFCPSENSAWGWRKSGAGSPKVRGV